MFRSSILNYRILPSTLRALLLPFYGIIRMRLAVLFLLTTAMLSSAAAGSEEAHGYLDAWNAFAAAQMSNYTLQPGCTPFRVASSPAEQYKGVVVLLHGFSACPQQFLDLAPLIAGQG